MGVGSVCGGGGIGGCGCRDCGASSLVTLAPWGRLLLPASPVWAPLRGGQERKLGTRWRRAKRAAGIDLHPGLERQLVLSQRLPNQPPPAPSQPMAVDARLAYGGSVPSHQPIRASLRSQLDTMLQCGFRRLSCWVVLLPRGWVGGCRAEAAGGGRRDVSLLPGFLQ